MSRRGRNLIRNGVSRSNSSKDYNPIAAINEEINSEECRRLLSKVDKMREILQMEKIALPQIVVVGDQSVKIRLIGYSKENREIFVLFRLENRPYSKRSAVLNCHEHRIFALVVR